MTKRRSDKRYSKVSVEVWGDDKFTELSPLPPSGQSLWLYLLLCPFRSLIPGLLLNVGLGTIEDRLRWPRRAVEAHWDEIAGQQMAYADWPAGVIWLPRAIEHNPPESPNVVTGWKKVVLPRCTLVDVALASLHDRLAERVRLDGLQVFDEGFAEAFRQAFPQAFQKALSEGMVPASVRDCAPACGNQEHEHEVLQNTERSEVAKPHPIRDFLTEHERLFVERYGRSPAKPSGKDIGHASKLIAQGVDDAMGLLRAFFASSDPFIAGCGHGLGVLANTTVQNKLIAEMSGRGVGASTPRVSRMKAAAHRFVERHRA